MLELTDGMGVDQVVEVAGAGTLVQSMEATRVGGFIGLIGILAGTDGEVNPIPVLMKSLRLQGVYVGSRVMFEDMNTAMAVNHIKPVIDQVYPFGRSPSGPETHGERYAFWQDRGERLKSQEPPHPGPLPQGERGKTSPYRKQSVV